MNQKQGLVFGFIWIVMIIGLSLTIFKEESVVTKKGIEIQESEPVDVVLDGRKLSIYSFKKGVSSLRWMDGARLEITGLKDQADADASFIFHIEEQNMARSEAAERQVIPDGYMLLAELTTGQMLATEAENPKGLYTIDGDRVTPIVDEALFEGQLTYTLSPLKDKLAYYDNKDQKIRIYQVLKGKHASINVFPDEVLLRHLDQSIVFSPDSGYVALYYFVPEALQESYFSIYGADSGRSYSDKIWGLNPTWAAEELKIAYIYGDGAGVVGNTDTIAINHGKRLGYYDLKKRKSSYIGAILNEAEIVGPILWPQGGRIIGYHTGVLNPETGMWDALAFNTYSLETQAFTTETLEVPFGMNNLLSWSFNDLYYVSNVADGDQMQLVLYDRMGKRTTLIQACELFMLDDEMKAFKMLDEAVLYMKEHYLFLADAKRHEAVVTRDGDFIGMFLSPDRKRFAAVSLDSKEYIIDVVEIFENVSVQ